MKNILLVEDDMNKVKQLQAFLESNAYTLTVRKSYNSGLEAILNSNFDLVLLDMSMHNFDKTVTETGGEFMQFAGEDILKEMIWNDINFPVIIVTQYDLIGDKSLNVLREEWQEKFEPIYKGCVFYSANESNWKNELLDQINKVL